MDNFSLPKLVICGIYNFRVASKGVKISKNRTTTMFEIELPIKNGGRSYIGDKHSPILTDTLICAKPGQVRHTHSPFLCYYVHIIVGEGMLYDILTDAPDFIKIKDRRRYEEIFKKINGYRESGINVDEIMIQSCLLELIYLINRDAKLTAKSQGKKNENRHIIEKAIGYIEGNLSGDLSLKTVSSKVSLSPVYFHNLFKASTGITLHEYVEGQRIKRAINLLISTDMTLTEIAYECGFSSQSYFNYAFKRSLKQTPREYVKKVYKKYNA